VLTVLTVLSARCCSLSAYSAISAQTGSLIVGLEHTPTTRKHKSRGDYTTNSVSSPNPLRALQVAPNAHGRRAFWGDTMQDVLPDDAHMGAVMRAAGAWQTAERTARDWDEDPAHHVDPHQGYVSVYNAEQLSTFVHHTDEAEEWKQGEKASHPYSGSAGGGGAITLEESVGGHIDRSEDDTTAHMVTGTRTEEHSERMRCGDIRRAATKQHLDAMHLHSEYEHPDTTDVAGGVPALVETTPRPVAMSVPGHEEPHSHEIEGMKARGQLAEHLHERHEMKHTEVESIAALKSELEARHGAETAIGFSTPTPVGPDFSAPPRADGLQAKISLDHHGEHNREELRRQLLKHEHHSVDGAIGHQHYAGHPEPSDGAAARCADANGSHRRQVDSSKHLGLVHRPDVPEGMARRTDHLDLVAAVHNEPRLARNNGR
jgi:hypothetical protein